MDFYRIYAMVAGPDGNASQLRVVGADGVTERFTEPQDVKAAIIASPSDADVFHVYSFTQYGPEPGDYDVERETWERFTDWTDKVTAQPIR